MIIPFYKQEDIQMRVIDGLIMHDGKLVVVSGYGEDSFQLTDVKEGSTFKVKANEIDLTPITLGNTLVGDKYAYVSRKPARRYKQTLSREVLSVSNMPVHSLSRIDLHHLVMPALNTYPKLETALSSVVSEKKKSMPFSREWGVSMIDGVVKLLYRNQIVGVCKSDRFVLDKEKFYLEESLVEAINV